MSSITYYGAMAFPMVCWCMLLSEVGDFDKPPIIDKLSGHYVNPRYIRDGNSYIIISCLIWISMFGEEPSVLSSSLLCNCTKLGNENSDAWTRLKMALWRQLISESLNSQKLKLSLGNQGRSQKVLSMRIGQIGLYFDRCKSRLYQML